jgi:hypothetical protein
MHRLLRTPEAASAEPIRTAASIISQRQVNKSRQFTTPAFLAGTFLLVCAMTFYYFAVLKPNYRDSWLLDFGQADATDYFATAKALLKDGYPYLQIGDTKVPSVYPLGYPVLMLPWLKILPQSDSILAPYRTNQTIGLLLILAVFGFYAYLAMPFAGGVAALMVATLPGFFTFCRAPFSEISATTVVVLAFMFAYLGLTEERRWKIYLSAVFLGLSLNIRLQSLFFAPLLLTMTVFPAKENRLRWFLHCIGVGFAFVIAASPTLVLNTIQFHSPFKTGYDYWFPSLVENHRFFSLGYVPTNLERLWKELTLRPVPDYFVAQVYGTGTCFVAAFIFLVCAGFFLIPFNRFVACALLACFGFLAIALSFLWCDRDVRFYLPLLVLSIGIAVLPVTWAAKNLAARKQLVASLGIFILFTMTCLGYPSRSRDQVQMTRSQMWDALHFDTPPRRSVDFVAQRHFVELFGSKPGIVLSDISSPYLNALFPANFLAAPIDGKKYRGFSRIFQYDRPQAAALVKKAMAGSLAVYALFCFKEEVDENAARLPQVDGYNWVLAENPTAEAAILTLRQSSQ